MYLVEDLYKKHGEQLGMELIAGKKGMKRRIKIPEAHRPGLSLSGYLKSHASKRILVFGKVEIEYLRDLEPSIRVKRLEGILSATTLTPAVIIARRYLPPKELIALCDKNNIPLLRASTTTMICSASLRCF